MRIEPGCVLAHYRLVEKIGEGGMGVVWKAMDTTLDREVAIKILSPEAAQTPGRLSRFEREAKLLATLNHPNIAVIHGFHEAEGLRFLVMELVKGEDLTLSLAGGALSLHACVNIFRQVAEALEAAHAAGVIHRDLKPANIKLTPNGKVKLLDFGLAKALEPERSASGEELSSAPTLSGLATAAGVVFGTRDYMSPEQVCGKSLDQRTDIWSFGCVLYQSLTGRSPFLRGSAMETFAAILEHPPPWERLPENIPPRIRTLLRRCLEKDCNRRLHSIGDARIELEEAAHALRTVETAGESPPKRRPPGVTSSELGAEPSTLNYLDVLGRYTVVERIDAGGVSEVYRAWDQDTGRDVALKVLRPDSLSDETERRRFQREARTLSTLDHPNIVSMHGFDSQEGLDFLVMDLVPSESLAVKLAKGPLPQSEVARLGTQIAEALHAAHKKGIIHGDLKPSNVLVTPDGTAKLIDFGLAEPSRATETSGAGGSEESKLMGPLAYQAPERLKGNDADERTDIYALGAVAYRMATGKRAFARTDGARLRDTILHKTPKPPSASRPRLSPELDGVVLKCLEKDPEARFQTAEEAAEAFRKLVPSSPSLAVAAWRPPRVTKGRRWMVAAALAGLALMGSLLALRHWSGGPAAPLPSLVVLPSRLLSPEVDDFLADAISNTISKQLAAVQDLEVKNPPASFEVEKIGGDIKRIAEAYGVGTLVTSTVSGSSTDLRLDLQLVDAQSQRVVWSQEYEGKRAELTQLARRGAEGIRKVFRPKSGPMDLTGGGAAASEAELQLQKGRYHANLYLNRAGPEEFEQALAAFESALELDPEDGKAAAEIAALHEVRLQAGVSPLEVAPQIQDWAHRALEKDPHAGRAWAALSVIEAGRTPESYRKKLKFALKGATFGPNSGYAQSRLSLPLMMNSQELALAATREAIRLDPLVQTGRLFATTGLMALGRVDEGMVQTETVLRSEPGMPRGLLMKSYGLSFHDREEEGLRIANELDLAVKQGRLHPLWVELAKDVATFGLAVKEGKTGGSRAGDAKERLIALARGESPFPLWPTVTSGVVPLLARHGYLKEALDLLVFRQQLGVFAAYDVLLFHPDMKRLRGHSRFHEVLGNRSSRFDAMIAILQEAKASGELPPYLEWPLADLLARIRRERQAL